MTTTTQLPAGTWTLDASSTTITVSAKKLGMFTIPATLTVVSGTVEIGADHKVTGVEVVADATSYKSKNAKRNDHVLSDQFLDAETYPTIVFKADSVTPSGSSFATTGEVTIKGKATPIDVTISSVDVSGASGSFVASATVDRNAIGVDAMPGLGIGRQLEIAVNAKAKRN